MSESVDYASSLPQRPSSEDRTAWAGYWQEKSQPWRTEPEIDEELQKYLAERRAIPSDIEKGIYPFKDANRILALFMQKRKVSEHAVREVISEPI